MPLTGSQLQRLAEAIQSGYTRDELHRLVRICLEEDFDALVSNKAYATQVFELVEWASRQGRTGNLLRCAYEHNSGNTNLQQVEAELGQLTPPQVSLPPVLTPTDSFQTEGEIQADIYSSWHPLPPDPDRDRFYRSLAQANAFDERIRSALPQSKQQGYYQARNANEINRVLGRLGDDSESYGLYWIRGGEHDPADTIQQISESVWLIGWIECDIKDLWVYRHHRSFRQYVVLHLKAMNPFFNDDSAPPEPEDIDEPWQVEAAYSHGRYITLNEMFNGYADIDGEIVKLTSFERRMRSLREDFLFLAPNNGLYVNTPTAWDRIESVRRTLQKAGRINEAALSPLETLKLLWWMQIYD